MPSRSLQLVSVGNPAADFIKDLAPSLEQQLGMGIVSGTQELATPIYAFNKDRNQYHSNAIVRRLAPLLQADQDFVLGLTDVDLFIPDTPFVFGDSDREIKSAVVSVFRFRENVSSDTLRRRLQSEVLHQAGHLLGLSFCEDNRCIMFSAQTLNEADRRQLTLCHICRNELAKLNRPPT